jgi:periplasmic divalent cation tolerance protein
MVLKTTTARLAELEELIEAKHTYDTPEFLVVPVSHGNKRYLDWVAESVGRVM